MANNNINSHRTNNYHSACVKELTNYLKSKKQSAVLAIVYYRREGTSDLFIQLFGTGVLIIATKRLLSKKKQNHPEQLKEHFSSCTRMLN